MLKFICSLCTIGDIVLTMGLFTSHNPRPDQYVSFVSAIVLDMFLIFVAALLSILWDE